MKNFTPRFCLTLNKSKWLFAVLVIALWSKSTVVTAQIVTTVFTDNYNRGTLSPGGTPSMAYTNNTPTGTNVSMTTNANTLNLNLVGNFIQTINNSLYTNGPLSTYSTPFSAVLHNNVGVVTWTFNMRTNIAATGFASSQQEAAVVLAGSNTNFNGAGNGYAVAFSTTATTGVKLIRYTNGMRTGTVTDIIANNFSIPATNFVSVRVTYDPSNDQWSLFARNDGGAFLDPSSGVTQQVGATTVDATNTSLTMTSFGYYANYNCNSGTLATRTGTFDNFTAKVTCLPPTGVSASVSPNPVCAGNTVTLTGNATGATSYTWAGPSFTSTTQSPSFTAASANAGTYTFTAVKPGCSVTASTGVLTVTPVPNPSITGATNVCTGTTQQLANTVNGGTWSISPGTSASVNSSGLVTPIGPGSETVTYSTGCAPNATLPITVTQTPDVITGNNPICTGASETLGDVTLLGTWSCAPPTVATIDGTSGLITGQGDGIATVTYTLAGCSATNTVTVHIPPAPIGGTLSVCSNGGTTQLTDASANGTWSISSSFGATVNPSTGLVTGGTAAETAVVTYSTGCSPDVTANVVVVVPPDPSITGNISPICATVLMPLSNTVLGGIWSSNSTGVATIDANTGVVTAVAQGSSLVTYSTGCGTAATTSVAVRIPPAPISGPATVCSAGGTAQLTNTSINGTWSIVSAFGATINSSTGLVTGGAAAETAVVTYSTGCSPDVTTNIVVVVPPDPVITGNISPICATVLMPLSNTILGGIWSSGSTGVATIDANTGVVTAVNQGSSLITYSTGCGTPATTSVAVQIPPAPIGGPATVCSAGGTAQLTNTSINGTWSIVSSLGTTINSATGLVSGGSGIETCVVTYSTGCSPDVTTNITVVIPPDPVISGNISPICAAVTMQLSNTVTGGNWSSGTGAVATVDNTGLVTAVNQGSSLITYSTGCGTPATTSVAVHIAPATIGGPASVCQAATIQLTNASNSGTWTIDPSTGSTINSSTGLVTGGATQGTATVTYSTGCGLDVTAPISVKIPPQAITGNAPLCNGTSITLSDFANGGQWTSGSPGVATAGLNTGLITGVTAGTSLITYANGCLPNATVTASVGTTPTAVMVSPTSATLCGGVIQQIIASGGLSPATSTSASSGAISVAIPNGNAGGVLTPAVTISGIPAGSLITGISINFNLPENLGISGATADQTVNILAPNGKSINLVNLRNGTGFSNTTISSSAVTTVPTSGNHAGTFAADLNGTATDGPTTAPVNATLWTALYTVPNGSWFLTAVDHNNNLFTGTISSWSITISYQPPSPITWSPTTGLFSDAAATISYTGNATDTVFASPALSTVTTYVATATNGSCTSSASSTITVSANQAPVVTATPPTATQCTNNGQTLSVSGTADTYIWSPTTGLYTDNTLSTPYAGGNATSVYAQPSVASIYAYTITGTSLTSGCSNFATSVLTVTQGMTAVNVSPAAPTICTNGVQQLSSIGGILSSASASFTSGTVGAMVPDNSPVGLTNSIPVALPPGAVVTGVSVTLNVTMTYDPDLIFNLRAPDGSIINLIDQKGNWTLIGLISEIATNFTNTVVSSAGTTAFPANPSADPSPFTGLFKADGINNIGATGFLSNVTTWPSLFTIGSGNWTLGIEDVGAGDIATLNNWSITVTYIPSTTYTWAATTGLFTDAGATNAYTGAGAPSVFASPAATTTYTLTATASNGCNVSTTVPITVLPAPVATPSNDGPLCIGGTLNLTANASNTTSYSWAGFGTFTPGATAINPSVANMAGPAATHIYTLTTVNTNASFPGCSLPFTTSVVVNTAPTAAPTGNTPLCEGGTLNLLSNSANITNYSWTGPNSFADATSNPTIVGVTNAAAGVYSLTVNNGTGSNCTLNVTTVPIVVNPAPTAAPSNNSPVCEAGTLQLFANASNAATYSWTGPNGFVSGIDNPSISNLVSGASGTYSLTVSDGPGSNCSFDATLPVTVNPLPTATISPATASVCPGTSTTITFTGTPDAVVTIGITGSSNADIPLDGAGNATLGTGNLFVPTTYNIISALATTGCSQNISGQNAVVSISPTGVWNGGTSSDWSDATNWSCGMPTSSSQAVIPSGTPNDPTITAGSVVSSDDLFVDNGVVLTLGDATAALDVHGNVTNLGVITGGNLVLDGITAQTMTGTGSITNMTVDNSNGVNAVTITPGSNMNMTGTLTLTNGTLNTNGGLTLYSDALGTGRIAAITGGAISGTVNQQQYIPGGRRAMRLLAHPYNVPISLSQLQDDIDITGGGSVANANAGGFTVTITNNSSAFWYDPINGNSEISNTDTLYDAGWTTFNSVLPTATGNDLWYPGQAIRLLIRGAKGTGLWGAPYTIDPVTMNMTEHINQGPVDVTLHKGTGSDYNMVGNPYPSPVNIGAIVNNALLSGDVTGSMYWVWNTNEQGAGAYVGTNIDGTPYNLESNAGFMVEADHDGAILHFVETNKAETGDVALFRTTNASDFVTMHLYDTTGRSWDRLYLRFDETAQATKDVKDAFKPQNSALDFYSRSTDNKRLNLDARPYVSGEVIPLGLVTLVQQKLAMKIEDFNVPVGAELYLHDKYLQQYMQLQQGSVYNFEVTADTASQGDNRFELSMQGNIATAVVNVQNNNTGLNVSVTPNPATDQATVSYISATKEQTSIRMVNVSGIEVVKMDLGINDKGSVKLPLEKLPAGIYLMELTSGRKTVTQRLVKE